MMRARLIIFAGVLPLVACAAFRQERSWSDDLGKEDAAQIAGTVAALIVERVPLKDGKLIAIAPATGTTGREVEALLGKELEQHGYKLTKAEATPAEAHRLRYLITKYGSGYALRVTLNGAEATTAFSRMTSGQLVATAPLAVREAVR
jgi:hypothetical protein